MSSQGVFPPAKDSFAHETFDSFAHDPDMSLAFPLPPETSVAYATRPLLSDVVEYGCGFAAI